MLIEILNEELELLAEKAIFWPAMELLFIADIGCVFTKKTFIESGANELETLKAIVSKRSIKRIVLLGEVAPEGRSLDKELLLKFKIWSVAIHCPFYIAFPKSHLFSADEIKGYGVVAWADPLIIPPFAFSKEPFENEKYFTFSGHVHPHVVLKKGNERLSFPCFQIKPHMAILPSFAEEAPPQPISWTSEEKIYAIDGKLIIPI